MRRAVVLLGHGSRDPAWRAPMDEVARRLQALDPALAVACAFLELQSPDLPTGVDQVVGQGAGSVRVVPMFLGVGKHAREDLPRLVQQVRNRHPAVRIEITPSVGELPEVLDLLAQLAARQS